MHQPQIVRIILFFSVTCLAASCLTGNPDFRKSSLKDLGPSAPDQSEAVSGAPPLYAKLDKTKFTTVISGRVWSGTGIERIPYRGALVQLMKDDRVLLESRSDSDGSFRLRGHLPDSTYQLKATSGNRAQIKGVTLDSYVIENFDIYLP